MNSKSKLNELKNKLLEKSQKNNCIISFDVYVVCWNDMCGKCNRSRIQIF